MLISVFIKTYKKMVHTRHIRGHESKTLVRFTKTSKILLCFTKNTNKTDISENISEELIGFVSTSLLMD